MSVLAVLICGGAAASAVTALIGCFYLVVAAVVVRRLPRGGGGDGSWRPSVSILKPLYGSEPGLLRNLLSFCDQTYDGEVQIVMGCQRRSDPALETARQLVALRPGRDIELVVDETLHGTNRKVSNLIHCLARARHEVIVLADSDIEVDRDYLERIVAALAQPGAGAVTCLYEGVGIGTAAALSALAINAHFLPNVLVGMASGTATPCFGSTIALRRSTLAALGGFHAFVDQLADDYATGAAVRGLGLRVVVPGFAVRHRCAEPDLRAFVAHQLRVARTIRHLDPLGHVGSIVTNPLPLALLACAGGVPLSLPLVAAALACRMALAAAAVRRFAMAPQQLLLLPACDIALFLIFIASFCGSQVDWRGHRLRFSGAPLDARRP